MSALITKFVAMIALVFGQFFVTYMTFTYGWGLTVASWPALIFGVICSVILATLVHLVKADD